jgi:hypothetical protein
MPGKFFTVHKRVRLAGTVILVVGWLAALFVYLAMGDEPGANAGYQIVNGHTYTIPLDSSTAEMQQLARIGGKASVWTYQFDRWLASLWHGRRLAYTLAVLTGGMALLCFYIADLMAEHVVGPRR